MMYAEELDRAGEPGWPTTPSVTGQAAIPSAILANKYFKQTLFGAHPYARTPEASAGDLEQLGIEDLKRWWGKFARPDQATLIFAGDVTTDKAVQLARQHLGGWKTNRVETGIVLANIPEPKPTQIYPCRLFVMDTTGN